MNRIGNTTEVITATISHHPLNPSTTATTGNSQIRYCALNTLLETISTPRVAIHARPASIRPAQTLHHTTARPPTKATEDSTSIGRDQEPTMLNEEKTASPCT